MNLAGKRALVTGGAVRIGAAITRALQAAGAEVVVQYRQSQDAAKALSPFTLRADLDCPAEVDRLFDRAHNAFGPIDVLINNAAVFHKDRLAGASQDAVLREFQPNLFAPLQLLRRFAEQAEQGAVINMLDRRVRAHDPECLPYMLTKKALEELTKLAALELAPRIRVNAVAPGAILPPPKHPELAVRDLMGKVPLARAPQPAEIADAVLFLLQADSVTGQILFVDGGQNLLGNGV